MTPKSHCFVLMERQHLDYSQYFLFELQMLSNLDFAVVECPLVMCLFVFLFYFLIKFFVFLQRQSRWFEEICSSSKPTGLFLCKQILTTYLSKRLLTEESVYISRRVWCHASLSYKSLDLTGDLATALSKMWAVY